MDERQIEHWERRFSEAIRRAPSERAVIMAFAFLQRMLTQTPIKD